MALRLAGELPSVVQGVDAQGWLRSIQAGDAASGLRIIKGGATLLELVQDLFNGGVAIRIREAYSGGGGYYDHTIRSANAHLMIQANSQIRLLTGGGANLSLEPAGVIDAQKAIGNSSASNDGNVAIAAADDLQMEGNQKGLIVRTSGGTRYRIRVNDSGDVISEAVA